MIARLACVAALAAILSAAQVSAQTPAAGAKVTVTVHNIASDKGDIRGLLCPEPEFFGTNDCKAIRVLTPAKTGSVDLVFTGVPPGTYGLSLYHDEDESGRLSVFSEPMAFGNEARDLPPVFDNASFKVDGDMKTETTLFRMVG